MYFSVDMISMLLFASKLSLRSCVDTDEFTSEEPEADVTSVGIAHMPRTAKAQLGSELTPDQWCLVSVIWKRFGFETNIFLNMHFN